MNITINEGKYDKDCCNCTDQKKSTLKVSLGFSRKGAVHYYCDKCKENIVKALENLFGFKKFIFEDDCEKRLIK